MEVLQRCMSLERDGFWKQMSEVQKLKALRFQTWKSKNLDVNAVAQEYMQTLDRVGDLWKTMKKLSRIVWKEFSSKIVLWNEGLSHVLLIISKMHLLTNWCNELITGYKRLMILKFNLKIIFQKVAAFDHD